MGHGSDPIDDATTFWELLERRAERTPDAPMLIDEHDRTVTFGECRGLGRAGGRRARRPGRHRRHAGGLAAPDPHRIDRAVVRPRPARHHAAADHPDLPRARGRLRCCARRGVRFFAVPGTWRDFDYEAMAQGPAGRHRRRRSRSSWSTDDAPRGRPRHAAGAARPTATPVRWLYSRRAPPRRRRACCTPTRTLIAGGIGLALAHAAAARRRRLDRLPVHPHRRSRLPRRDARLRHSRPCCSRRSCPPTPSRSSPPRRHDGRRQHRLLPRVPRRAAQGPGEPVLPTLRLLSGGGAPKPPEVFYEVRARWASRSCHGYGMTECPMITQGSPHDTDEQLANTEGEPVLGCDVADRRRRTAAGAGRRDGEVRVRGPDGVPGLHRPRRSRRAAFDDDGFFRTGDLGVPARTTATSCSPAASRTSSSARARTSAPGRSRTSCTRTRRSAAVAVIGLPDRERGERVCAVVETPAGRRAADVRRDAAVLPRRRPDDAEDPRAARGGRRAAPQRHVQDPQARARRPVQRGRP